MILCHATPPSHTTMYYSCTEKLKRTCCKTQKKNERNLKIKKEIKSNILIRVPNFSEIYFLPFSEIRVCWTGFSARGIKKNKAPPTISQKSHTRVLKKKYSGDFYKGKNANKTKESKKKNEKNLQIKKEMPFTFWRFRGRLS